MSRKILIVLAVFTLFLTGFVVINQTSEQVNNKKISTVSNENQVFSEALLKEGDVIFQTSNSGQSLAIQISTESKYSHCGILFKENDKWMVYEAIQPVVKTPLQEFIDRGDQKHFTVSRYDNKGLSSDEIKVMKSFFSNVKGKDYDIYFNWSDKEWYCSELVWKMYKSIGIEISEHEKFGDFKLDHPTVKKIVEARFPKGAPLNETVITPKGIHDSSKMKEVFSNYNDLN